MHRTLLAFALLAVSGLSFSTLSFAQYPAKPIRFIVGFPPGGSADPTTRIIGQALSEQMGQPVIVDNRPGADSALAAEQMTRIASDGYTIMFASNSAMTAAVALRKTPPYDPVRDFTPISMVGRATVIMYVHPSVPAKTLQEFVEYARANPGKLAYGTGNPLSILYNVQLMSATGIDMLHVPYKGEGPLNPDLLAGRVQSSFLSTLSALSNAKDGKLRPLAVLLEKRSPLAPDVPTIAEAGVPQVTVRQWAGVFGPPKLPRPIVERLNKEVNAALKRPEVIEKLQSYGYAAEGSTPERLLEINRDDLALWRKLVKKAALPLE
jgi:tripartite-type tricarboxylate transporter receptor subunit TctC